MGDDLVLRKEITTLAQLQAVPAIIERNMAAVLAVRENDLHRKLVDAVMAAYNDPNLGMDDGVMRLSESLKDPRTWLTYTIGSDQARERVLSMTDEEVDAEIAEHRAREAELTQMYGSAFADIQPWFRLKAKNEEAQEPSAEEEKLNGT